MASYNINSRLEENTRAAIIQQHLKSVPNHHIANRCQVSISVVSQAIKQYWE